MPGISGESVDTVDHEFSGGINLPNEVVLQTKFLRRESNN